MSNKALWSGVHWSYGCTRLKITHTNNTLTLSIASTLAPFPMSNKANSLSPIPHALWSGVDPSYGTHTKWHQLHILIIHVLNPSLQH